MPKYIRAFVPGGTFLFSIMLRNATENID